MISRLPARLSLLALAGATLVALPAAADTPLSTGGSTPSPATPLSTPAPTGGSGSSYALANPLKVSSLPDLVKILIDGIVQLGGIALMVALIFVGFRFVAAQGNAKKLQEARVALMWTLIGGLILLGASGISQLIANTVQNL